MTRVLLLGGGHAHLAAVPVLAQSGLAKARLALVAPAAQLLYSGMMPGWLAGQYRFEECAIDLARVCRTHGVEWIEDEIVDIDFVAREAIGRHARHRFDLASINVGSSNDMGRVDEGAPCVLGAKPFADFVAAWSRWRERALARAAPRSLVVVGGGAAAVEIAFALAALVRAQAAFAGSSVTLATSGERLLQGMSSIAGTLARASLERMNVGLRFGHRYVGADGGGARFDGAASIAADLVVVATGAGPPGWLTACARRDGVAVAPDGGLAVRSDLGSTSHASLFAAGDCASVVDQRVPKSGVHALRQGPVLASNLGRALGAAPLERYAARRWTLALLNRCNGSAIGAWGPLGFAGGWAWRWKDRIDRRFIQRFR